MRKPQLTFREKILQQLSFRRLIKSKRHNKKVIQVVVVVKATDVWKECKYNYVNKKC